MLMHIVKLVNFMGSQLHSLFFIYTGRYIDCLSLTYATNKIKKLKLHYKYYIKREKNIKKIEHSK